MGIIQYFKNKGYQADSKIVDGSKIETIEGIDAIAVIGDKILGIQTKRPSENNTYHLDKKQFDKIKQRTWIYYAFPENIPLKEQKNILHRTLFSNGDFEYESNIRLEDIKYRARWGDIAKGIEECPIGLKVQDKEYFTINDELRNLIEEHLAIFAINIERRQVKLTVESSDFIDKRFFRGKGDRKLNIEDLMDDPKRCPKCGRPY